MISLPNGSFYSKYQFAIFRIIFGIYLAIHFLGLIPYASELWSVDGSISDHRILPSFGFFPNILFWGTSAEFVTIFVLLLLLAALAFAAGWMRCIMSFLLWYGWTCLAGRNPFIANPGLPFVGLLLLLCAVIPSGEPFSMGRKGKSTDGAEWRLPKGCFVGVWCIMAIGYTISGIHKLMSPSWADGTAIIHLLNNPLSRDYFLREWILAAPKFLLQLNTWGVLSLEIFFAPLCLFAATRKWAWVAMVAMHLGIMSLVDFADLTFGVLMVHFFTFDESWFPSKKNGSAPILFFDGICGLCNGFVQFLFDIDRSGRVKVSTLQGETAKSRLPAGDVQNLNSLVMLDSAGTAVRKSRAILGLFDQVGGIWRVVSWIGWIIPKSLADSVYDLVAQNRYRLFGKLDTCRMPTAAEKSRFLL